MRVVGLDLSLTAVGFASEEITSTITAKNLDGAARLGHLRDAILDACRGVSRHFESLGWEGTVLTQWDTPRLDWPDLVCIEGYSFGSRNGGERLGELGGVIRLALYEHQVPWVELAPKIVKKLATGKGNSAKEEVFAAAIRRLDYKGASLDEADALWLREAALQAFGYPTVTLPEAHLAALKGIDWPTVSALGNAVANHPAGSAR